LFQYFFKASAAGTKRRYRGADHTSFITASHLSWTMVQ
jgi:hypothetical protein